MNPTVTRKQALDAVEAVLHRHRHFVPQVGSQRGQALCRACLTPHPCDTRRDVSRCCGLEET